MRDSCSPVRRSHPARAIAIGGTGPAETLSRHGYVLDRTDSDIHRHWFHISVGRPRNSASIIDFVQNRTEVISRRRAKGIAAVTGIAPSWSVTLSYRSVGCKREIARDNNRKMRSSEYFRLTSPGIQPKAFH